MESLDSISEVDMVSASLSRAKGRGIHTGPALGQSSAHLNSLSLTTPQRVGISMPHVTDGSRRFRQLLKAIQLV